MGKGKDMSQLVDGIIAEWKDSLRRLRRRWFRNTAP